MKSGKNEQPSTDMADVIKIRPAWEHKETDTDGNMVFENTSEHRTTVFGEELVANNRHDLKDMILNRLAKEIHGDVDEARELERKRVQAKLDAKQKL